VSDTELILEADSSTSIGDDAAETRRNLQLIIRVRWIVAPSVFLILAVASLAGFSQTGSFSENQLVVNGINLGVMLVLNVIYVIWSRRAERLGPLILFQLLIDVIHVTLTVYKTGGVASPFGFLYFYVIFEAAILKSGGAAFVIAGVSSALFSLNALLEHFGIVPSQEFFSPLSGLVGNARYVILSWGFAIAGFFGFAALAAHLTRLLASRQQRLRTAYSMLTKRHETLMLLHRTSIALNTFRTAAEISDAILGELVSHLSLHRALLYRVIEGNELQLFMVKERSASGELVDTYDDSSEAIARDSVGGLNVRIPLKSDAGLTARAAILQESYNVADPEESPYINRELAKRIGMNPFAIAPLVLRGRTLGVVGIDRGRESGGIRNDEFRVFQVFANQAAITLYSVEPHSPVYMPVPE
jgi:hypothetical protein